MNFDSVLAFSICLIVATISFSEVYSKKSAKTKDRKSGGIKENLPEILTNIFENTTRHAVSQNVKSTKVSCAKENINEMIRSVKCKPRLTVVELVSGAKNRFMPNAVLAKRCSGSCDGFQRCVTTKSANTTFFVKEIVRNKTYCSAIEVVEDKECICECLLKAKDCTAYQRYSPNTCTCRCNDDAELRKCKSSVNKNLEWNENKCACDCVGEQSCADGLKWDSHKCRCAKHGG